MSKVQYNYVLDQWWASPTTPWIDEPAAASTVYDPWVQDPHLLVVAYLTCLQSC